MANRNRVTDVSRIRGTGRTREDTTAGEVEYRRTLQEPAVHVRTRHTQGSGPRGRGFKSLAPDHFRIHNRRFEGSSGISGTPPYHNFLENYRNPIVR